MLSKKLLATIESSDGGLINISLDETGRMWHTVANTGHQFSPGVSHEMKSETEAIQAIRESWGAPQWKLKLASDVFPLD